MIVKFIINYLRKRGFVVFCLEPYARFCVQHKQGQANFCWLETYKTAVKDE